MSFQMISDDGFISLERWILTLRFAKQAINLIYYETENLLNLTRHHAAK